MKFITRILFVVLLCGSAGLQAQSWQLVWADEFNEAAINSSNWTRETGGHGWGNNEWQYYTNRDVNSYIENGSLVIKAMEENYGGRDYTSARLKTQGKQFFTYGKIEARIKLPFGQGIWPAFWTLGESISWGGWPSCGEIDIMEFLGHETNKVYGTAHWDNSGHQQAGGNYSLTTGNFNDDYHVFSIVWNEYNIRWYVDDILYYTLDITPEFLSELHQEHFIILNLAVGGNWPGYPNASTTFPQYLKVDYVRVYQDTSSAPSVGVTSPSNNSNFAPGSNILLKATVNNFPNPVSYVEFYQGDARIGIDAQEPYEFNWTGIYEGTYKIRARAKDNTGSFFFSPPVNITVGQGSAPSPYLGKPVLLPGTVEAENYDLGGNNIAYYDTDASLNQGNQYGNNYRTAEGVDIEITSDAGGGYNLGWMETGEWLKYFIESSSASTYKLTARVSSNSDAGKFAIEFNGAGATEDISVPNSGGWQNWIDVEVDNLFIDAGVHQLMFKVVNSGFNLNKLLFTKVTGTDDDTEHQPEAFNLFQNYPNPFNPGTNIKFTIPQKESFMSAKVKLQIYDVLGRLVAEPLNRYYESGEYEIYFDASYLNSGVYFYALSAGESRLVKQMTLIK